MTEEEAKKVEVEVEVTKAAPAKENAAEEKAVIPATEPPAAQEKPPAPADDSKALAIVESEYNLLCLILPLCSGRLAMERWCWRTGFCSKNSEKLSSSLLYALVRRLCTSW
jgi:hypothetical protein